MYILLNATDIILNICILCLPAFYIKTLQMNKDKKLGLAGIFGFGILYVIFPQLYPTLFAALYTY